MNTICPNLQETSGKNFHPPHPSLQPDTTGCHPPGQTRPERPEANVFVARAAEGDAASFSSTRVREAVARRDHAAASAFLSAAAADLLLRPSRSEFALYEADYRAMRVPRPE